MAPAMSPVYYVMDGDDILVSTMAARGKAKAVRRNPKVSLAVLDEKWPPTYLVVYCDATVETDAEAVVDLMMRIAGLMAGSPMPEMFQRPCPGEPPASDQDERDRTLAVGGEDHRVGIHAGGRAERELVRALRPETPHRQVVHDPQAARRDHLEPVRFEEALRELQTRLAERMQVARNEPAAPAGGIELIAHGGLGLGLFLGFDRIGGGRRAET